MERNLNVPIKDDDLTELNAGDVVSTGTPGGVALGMNPPRYLKPGDVVEFSCPAIGTVTQVVEEE